MSSKRTAKNRTTHERTASNRTAVRGGRKEQLLGLLVGSAMRLYSFFLRYEVVDHTGGILSGKTLQDGVIFLVWHNRIFGLPRMWSRLGLARKGRELVVLTSASKDGALIASAVAVNGIRAVRGSSSRRGRAAVAGMLRELEKKNSLCITPDGPRGPVYQLNAGAVRLAQKSQRPLVIVEVKHHSYWELKTWDSFRIPKPLSRVSLRFVELVEIPPELENEEDWRERVESLLTSPSLSSLEDDEYD